MLRVSNPLLQSTFLYRLVLLTAALLSTPVPAGIAADGLSFGRPFSDHMVVQRSVALPVWGKAEPNQEIAVTWGKEMRRTVADSDGKWRVAFPAREVSQVPTTLTAKSNRETNVIRDILVGEVWLCAGQSNMAWPVSASASGEQTISGPMNPLIRLLNFRGLVQSSTEPYSDEMLAQLTVESFYRGQWELSSPESVKDFSAVGYYFGEMLQRGLNVPIGLINVSSGGSPAEAWVSRDALAAHPQLKSLVGDKWLDNNQLSPWCRERAKHNLDLDHRDESSVPGDILGPNHPFKPGFMWEATVAPLVPFPIRGVIWYQGESNAEYPWRIAQHEQLFPLLVQDWRSQWDLVDFPFLYVQLTGMERPCWPAFRESQRRMLAQLPNSGMAVTIDLGSPDNVHPTCKQPVGERLALWALAQVYGTQDLVYSGPLFRQVEFFDSAAVVEFDHAGTGLHTTNDRPVVGFELSSDGKEFHAAKAVIEGDHIIVHSDAVSYPSHVRYGWKPFPRPPLNLVNSANLPASPFSTVPSFITDSVEEAKDK